MKYAMLVALALLGACASETDPVDEAAPADTATEAQAPLVEPAAAAVTPAPDAASNAAQSAHTPGSVPQLSPSLSRGGSWVMNTQTDSNKPQPQPWVPTDRNGETVNDPTGPDQVRKLR